MSEEERLALTAARELRERLLHAPAELEVLGPAQAPVYRMNGRYHLRLTLSCEQNDRAARSTIAETVKAVSGESRYKNCRIYVDVE